MKNKLILLILTFLITTPLIAMEEGAGPFRGDMRSPASPEARITVLLKDDQVNLDKKTLKQSETIKNFLEFDPAGKMISLADVDFTKDKFMQAFNLMEYAKDNENEKLQLALTSKDISELSSLWQIFDYLDVEKLFPLVNTQLEKKVLEKVKTNPEKTSETLETLPESFLKSRISFSKIESLFPELTEKIIFNPDFKALSVSIDSQHNLLAVGSLEGPIGIYDISNLQSISLLNTIKDHNKPVWSLVFDPNANLLITGSQDTTVNIYTISDPKNPVLLQTFDNTQPVKSLAIDPEEKLLATGSQDVKIYDISNLQTKVLLFTIATSDKVSALSIDPKSHLLAVGLDDGTLTIYSLSKTKQPIQIFSRKIHTDIIRSIAFDPQAQLLATGSNDNTAQLFNIADPKNITQLENLKEYIRINTVAFDPNAQLFVTGLIDGTVNVYDISDLNNIPEPLELYLEYGNVSSLAFDPKRNLLAATSFTPIATSSTKRKVTIFQNLLLQSKNLTIEQALEILSKLLLKKSEK